VANVAGSVTSTVATLTVLVPPGITLDPTNVTAIQGSSAAITAVVTGTAPLGYQWFFNATNTVEMATNSTLTLTNVVPFNAGAYSLVVTNVAGSATSAVAVLTVLVPPSFTMQPTSQTVNGGTDIGFTALAVGSLPMNYQWQKNGTPLPSATNSSLLFANVNRSLTGFYSVSVSNVAGSIVSSNAFLRVFVPQRFVGVPARLADGSFRLLFGDSDGGQLIATNLANLELHVSTNLLSTNWLRFTNGFTLTNGMIQFDDADAPNHPRRFYRVIER
jgi:hypothetical protein